MANSGQIEDEEFKKARNWLTERLAIEPGLTLPCKISRIKIKNGESVGDIDTKHSFIAFPSEDGFILAALPRREEDGMLGSGGTSVVKEIYWEPGKRQNRSKVSILNNQNEANKIKKITDLLSSDYLNLSNFERPTTKRNGLVFSKSYVVQPKVEGVNLSDYLDINKTLPTYSAIALAIACVDALRKFHDSGLIHGDARDANVIIRESGLKFVAEMIDYGRSEQMHETKTSVFSARVSKDIRYLVDIFKRLSARCPEFKTFFSDLITEMDKHDDTQPNLANIRTKLVAKAPNKTIYADPVPSNAPVNFDASIAAVPDWDLVNKFGLSLKDGIFEGDIKHSPYVIEALKRATDDPNKDYLLGNLAGRTADPQQKEILENLKESLHKRGGHDKFTQ